MEKKILFLIDCQYGFIEGGNLAVDGAKMIMDSLVAYVIAHGKEYDTIVFTVDWHPQTHCSFKENGGIWPSHCVQYSHDAAIYQPLLDAMNTIKADYTVLTKGCNEDHEEYSIFKNAISNTYLKAVAKAKEFDVADFAGIAYDFCLKDSALDSKKVLMNTNIRVLKDYCPAIGDPSETTKTLEDNNIEVI